MLQRDRFSCLHFEYNEQLSSSNEKLKANKYYKITYSHFGNTGPSYLFIAPRGQFLYVSVMEGWIKLHRKFLDWEWYDASHHVKVFIHLLLKANFERKKWRGTIVERGELITSLAHLSDECKISIQALRTILTHLESTCEITRKTTRNYTVISITNYEKWQAYDTPTNIPPTNDQQVRNIPPTNDQQQLKKEKNEKNEKNEKKEEVYKQKFPGWDNAELNFFLRTTERTIKKWLEQYSTFFIEEEVQLACAYNQELPDSKKKKVIGSFLNGWFLRSSSHKKNKTYVGPEQDFKAFEENRNLPSAEFLGISEKQKEELKKANEEEVLQWESYLKE